MIRVYTVSDSPAIGFGQMYQTFVAALRGLGLPFQRVLSAQQADVAICGPWDVTSAEVIYTIWETDKLPPGSDGLKRKRLVICNTKFIEDVLRDAGVRRIARVPLGVSIPFEFLPTTDIHFLSIGAESSVPGRKRPQDVIEAFKLAFPTNGNVRLTVKQNPECHVLNCFDTRVTIVRERLAYTDMQRLVHSAHVGVFFSGLEGWGLPHLELMMAGRPILCPWWGGHMEFVDATCSWNLPHKIGDPKLSLYKNAGHAATVNMRQAALVMRQVAHERAEIARRGVNAHYKAQSYTFDAAVVAHMNLIRTHAAFQPAFNRHI